MVRQKKRTEAVSHPLPVAELDRLKGLLLDNGANKTHDWLTAGKGKPRKEWFTETLRVYEPKGSSNASALLKGP
jgi:hypothetical protein